MPEQATEQDLADAETERDRLADALADLADRHRRHHHRALALDGCAVCQILRATEREPAVGAAHDRTKTKLTGRIERRINKIPRETTNA